MLTKIKRTFGFILTHKLAERNKLKALNELFKWQIQTAFSEKKLFKKKFATVLTVLVNKGQTGMTGNLYTGLHEFEDMGFLLHFLRPQDLFADAGANVGSYSLLASGVAGARTIAFEPVPSTFKSLEKNIKINNLSDLVQLYNIGLSSEKGTLTFSSLHDTTNHVVTNPNIPNTISVPVDTLDDVCINDFPSLLKIDVEGFETEVLKGARSILSNAILKAIIIELNGSGNRYGYNELDIHNKLLELGFKASDYDPLERTIRFKEHFGSSNTIYIRDKNFVESRINTAAKRDIFGVTF